MTSLALRSGLVHGIATYHIRPPVKRGTNTLITNEEVRKRFDKIALSEGLDRASERAARAPRPPASQLQVNIYPPRPGVTRKVVHDVPASTVTRSTVMKVIHLLRFQRTRRRQINTPSQIMNYKLRPCKIHQSQEE